MHQQTYTIYFDGKIANNFNPEEVKKRAQTVFKLSQENTEIFFNGETHILKEDVVQKECEQYLDQLLNFGLIGKTSPPLPIPTPAPIIIENKSPTTLYLLLCMVITAIGIGVAWYLGFIEIKPSRQSMSHLTDNTTQEMPTLTQSTDSSIQTNFEAIKECTNDLVINSLETTLTEGIPQLLQRSSPTIHLALQEYYDNQELYYDQERNKRLCRVLTQYKIEGEGLSQAAFVDYEIFYEIERTEEQVIQLSIFKQSIIPQASNASMVNDEKEDTHTIEEVIAN